jgi:hypothetical protein
LIAFIFFDTPLPLITFSFFAYFFDFHAFTTLHYFDFSLDRLHYWLAHADAAFRFCQHAADAP